METNSVEMQQVIERLTRVEKQNRWLARGGLALALSCASLLLMAQKPDAQTIEAQGFVLKDAAGQVRAELHMANSGPELRLYDSQGRGKTNTLARIGADENGPSLDLFTKEGGLAGLSIYKDGPSLTLVKVRGGTLFAEVDEDGSSLVLSGLGGSTNAAVDKHGPNLSLKDPEGFKTSIGSQELVTPTTGEKHQTSAASIHLLDPKGKILWSAP
jgi:hypothetical protein